MSPNSLSPNLLKILGTCLVHLDDVSAHSVQYWNSHTYSFQNDHKNTWTCSHWLHEPLIVETIPSVLLQPIEDMPAIFSIVGQLATSKPICETINPHNHSCTCLFWVVSRPDPTSKSFWQHIPNALEAIARKSSSHSDTSNLYDINKNTGRVSLHVQWALDDVSTWSSIGNNHINPHPPVDWHHTGSWTLVEMISLSSSKQASSNPLPKPFIFYFALFMGKRFFQVMVGSGTLAQ